MKLRFSLPKNAFIDPKAGYSPSSLEIGISSFAINILGLAMSLVTMQVYDRILAHHGIGTLNMLCIGAAIAILVETVLKLTRAYATGWSAAAFEHTVSCNAVRHTLAKETVRIENVGIGEYLQRINAIGKVRDFYSGQLLATLIDLPFILIFLFIIAHLGGDIVFVPITLLVIMGIRTVYIGKKLKSAMIKRDKSDDSRYEFMIHALNGIHTVKAFALEAQFERRYEHWQSNSTRANYDVARLSAAAYDQGVIASHFMMIAVGIVGAPLALSGHLTLGALVACVMLSGRIMQPVHKALGFWTRMQDIELAHRKITSLFSGELLMDPTATIKTEKEGRVEVNNVSFAYDGQEKLLDNVSLSLKPGEAVAISGEHGAGKQTLLKLIAGMIAPLTGEVKVNGVSPHLYQSEVLVEHIGYMPAQGAIFRGTIAENLSRFGRVPEEMVREISALLGLDEEVAVLPAGYDTPLDGSHSDTIPPGLRQRIAIARALMTKPRVLLFYNADRALDKEGYNRVYRLLGRVKGKATMILVTNDHNILQLADRHYYLEHGRLVEYGKADSGRLSNVHAYQEVMI